MGQVGTINFGGPISDKPGWRTGCWTENGRECLAIRTCDRKDVEATKCSSTTFKHFMIFHAYSSGPTHVRLRQMAAGGSSGAVGLEGS